MTTVPGASFAGVSGDVVDDVVAAGAGAVAGCAGAVAGCAGAVAGCAAEFIAAGAGVAVVAGCEGAAATVVFADWPGP